MTVTLVCHLWTAVARVRQPARHLSLRLYSTFTSLKESMGVPGLWDVSTSPCHGEPLLTMYYVYLAPETRRKDSLSDRIGRR